MSGPRHRTRTGDRGGDPKSGSSGADARRDEGAPAGRDPESEPIRGMQRLADLLPRAARDLGLEDQLEQARAAAAWQEIVADRVPAAAGACRLTGLSAGAATIETDEPIVAQEIRLRSPELLAALRDRIGTHVRQFRIVSRHV